MPDRTLCASSTCQYRAKINGYCGRHQSTNGYMLHRRRDHPLARPSGIVFVHRTVLYDAIGPGSHPCHWCGVSLWWEHKYPTQMTALIVDHVDGDRTNNDLANLVPCCHRCNISRAFA